MCQMLMRAYCLRDKLIQWLDDHPELAPLQLHPADWDQIRYMIALLQPFMFWTAKISMTKGLSIQNAWPVYELLSNHLEDEQQKLKQKSTTWKQSLLVGITAAKEKLSQYYSLTAGSKGLLYNLGNILEPNQKLSLYDSDTWEAHYKHEYENKF